MTPINETKEDRMRVLRHYCELEPMKAAEVIFILEEALSAIGNRVIDTLPHLFPSRVKP